MKLGIINLSEQLEQSYSDELEKNNIKVISLALDDFEQKVSGLDAIVIRENAEEDTAQTCSILLKLKEQSDTMVWVFSSNAQKMIRTVYLQLGALGIISEECEADEFHLIISNNLLKRNLAHASGVSGKEQNGEIGKKEKMVLIPRNHSVKINGKKEIPLTKLEYKTIDLLYRHKNHAVTYEELIEEIWGEKFQNQNYRVANLIFHLRDKVEEDTVNPVFIKTVRSKGYRLDL